MNYTYDEDIYSCLYKDEFGIRPRDGFYNESTTPAEKQGLWDELMAVRNNREEEKPRTIAAFMNVAGVDTETATRWWEAEYSQEELVQDTALELSSY